MMRIGNVYTHLSGWLYKNIAGVLRFIWAVMKSFHHYSGLQAIFHKLCPLEENKAPTLFIWILGIYFASFGIASNRYENSVSRIENRVVALTGQLSTKDDTTFKTLISTIPLIQQMETPIKPEIEKPLSVFNSFFKKEKNYEILLWTQEIIITWKSRLAGVNLKKVNLVGANLSGINLQEANLEGANLEGASFTGDFIGPDQLSPKYERVATDFYSDEYHNKTKLQKVILRDANLSKTNLKYLSLAGADLRGANFKEADLYNVNFNGARLYSANFDGTNLEGADLRQTIMLKKEQLLKAKNLRWIKLDVELREELMRCCSQVFDRDDFLYKEE